ncbi:MAG: hypothetical protein IEMM0006_2103 [bacterium]|nr:MAG: hypothetical protein IEMM0006_2103 [bacterium]
MRTYFYYHRIILSCFYGRNNEDSMQCKCFGSYEHRQARHEMHASVWRREAKIRGEMAYEFLTCLKQAGILNNICKKIMHKNEKRSEIFPPKKKVINKSANPPKYYLTLQFLTKSL